MHHTDVLVPGARADRFRRIRSEKRRKKRPWIPLRRGCLDLLGREAGHTISQIGASSNGVAKKICYEEAFSPEELLAWPDGYGLG